MRKRLVPTVAIGLGLICAAGLAYSFGLLKGRGNSHDQTPHASDGPKVAEQGPNTGGTPNKPLRETSPGVIIEDPGLLNSPDLPPGGRYRILTFHGKGEDTFVFTAANTTGYGLFAASSPTVVEDDTGRRFLPPSTTFQPVWPNGTSTAGVHAGTNKDLVLRDDAGNIYFSHGYARSAAIPGLRDIGDGQSITMPVDAMPPAGTDVLWLNFTTPKGDVGFVVAADRPPQLRLPEKNS